MTLLNYKIEIAEVNKNLAVCNDITEKFSLLKTLNSY